MECSTVHQVVKKLIGETKPAGASHIDNHRYENMETLIALTAELLEDIAFVAVAHDSPLASERRAGKRAEKALADIADYCQVELREREADTDG